MFRQNLYNDGFEVDIDMVNAIVDLENDVKDEVENEIINAISKLQFHIDTKFVLDNVDIVIEGSESAIASYCGNDYNFYVENKISNFYNDNLEIDYIFER